MAEDTEKNETASPHLESPTLLKSLPPTDPRVLREITAAQLGNIHYAAIGRVAAAGALFESTVDQHLFEIAGLGIEAGICFTGQMIGPRPRIDAFIALVRLKGLNGRKWNEKLEEIAKGATGLAEQRNRAVHDVWDVSHPEKPQRIEATARRTVRSTLVHVPTTELLDLEVAILRFGERFDEMAYQITDELFSSPDRVP